MLKAITLCFAIMLATNSAASAFGALAIGGSPSEAATKGIAVGTSYNYDTQAAADAEAVKRCFAFTDAPAETTASCKLVESFSGEWFVITLDPGASTPGFGWSIDASKLTAERNAMDQCKLSSPDDRKSFCKVASEGNDVAASAPAP